MVKAKKHPKPATTASQDTIPTAIAAGDGVAMAAEIQVLKQQMVKMSGEIENLKKQISQLVTFIKQRM
jgi:hypothetical protein